MPLHDGGSRVWHIQSCEDGRHAIRNMLYIKCCFKDTDYGTKGGGIGLSLTYIVPFPYYISTAAVTVLVEGTPAKLAMESRTGDIPLPLGAAI